MATEIPPINSADAVRAVQVALVVPEEPAELAGPEDPAELAVQVALVVPEDPAELAVRGG